MKRRSLFLILASAIAIFSVGRPLVSHADATADDLANAKATMPLGLPIDGYFIVPDYKSMTMSNSSTITGANSSGTQAVQLTGSTGQLGTIWADKSNYYFDLKAKQKASMWMYFGNGPVGSMGDGMAFVIQNQGYGATAVDKNGSPVGQETLGVWGLPDNFTASSPASIGKQAIQKSWALEFDTFPNGSTSLNSQDILNLSTFDTGAKVGGSGNDTAVNGTQHVASAYPADQKQGGTYYMKPSPDSVTYYSAKMNHQGVISGAGNWLTNGTWHHLTLEYTPPVSGSTIGQVKYTINDKDPSTGAQNQTAAQTSSYELDTSKVDDGTGHAYWGFTGSTGAYSENNLVVFEQIPGLVDADASASIYKLEGDGAGTQLNPVTPIMGGTRLRLDYNLTYNEGRNAWQPTAQINTPTGFSATSATVTYKDGTTQKVDMTSQSGQKVNFKLDKALDSSNSTATVSVYGRQANPTSTQTTIQPTTSKFVDKNGIATADTTAYQVYQAQTTFKIGWYNGNYDLVEPDPGKDVTVQGKFLLKGSPITSSSFFLDGSINGKTIKETAIDSSDVSGDATNGYSGTFSYTVPASELQRGKNLLSLYVRSGDEYSTDDLISTIDVKGPLQFGDVDENVSYTAELTGSHMLVPRDGSWMIGVNDQRGSGSSWALTARMVKPLQASNVPATTMNLVYKATADATPVVLGSGADIVAHHITTSDDDTYNATSQWNSDTGLLLDVTSGTVAGTYTGEIEWGLQNAPS
ncbi:hypothetical protein [Levilactobacillus enshiensis]|uniref:hypothetical protein n=1 Tax=Levilactobacillus enshiensis TaxID=2590213 RepID=UPI00117BD1CE|nr:hypothetical protein [Levilactobacillus enshiensis]